MNSTSTTFLDDIDWTEPVELDAPLPPPPTKTIKWKPKKKVVKTPPRDVYQVGIIASRHGEVLENDEQGAIGMTFCWDGEYIYRQGLFGKDKKICSYSDFRTYKEYKEGDWDKYNKVEITLDEFTDEGRIAIVEEWKEIGGWIWDDYVMAMNAAQTWEAIRQTPWGRD